MKFRLALLAAPVLLAVSLSCGSVNASTDDDWKKAHDAGQTALKLHDYPTAETQFKTALTLTDSMKKADPRVTQSLDALAAVYSYRKKYADARTSYLKVLHLQESIHGKDDASLIPRLNNVIKVTCINGSCYDSLPELKQLANIRQKRFGPKCSDLPFNLQMIGEAYEKHGDFKNALQYFQQAVAVQSKISGTDSPLAKALSKNVERVQGHQL
ncbi:MAG TPA: tetratricopeptide repeat-containing protein [Oculatellaceae cyanobacterium]